MPSTNAQTLALGSQVLAKLEQIAFDMALADFKARTGRDMDSWEMHMWRLGFEAGRTALETVKDKVA